MVILCGAAISSLCRCRPRVRCNYPLRRRRVLVELVVTQDEDAQNGPRRESNSWGVPL